MGYLCVGFDFGSDTNGLRCIIFVSDLTLDPTHMVSDLCIHVSDSLIANLEFQIGHT